MDVDAALAEVRARTRYEGQEPRADEVLAEEVERLQDQIAELTGGLAAKADVLRMVATTSVKRAHRIADLEAALRKIRDQHWAENCLDPQWAGRIARRALGEESGRG